MKQYHDLMRHVRHHGHRKEDRTGTGTLSVFGWQMRFDLSEGFPLVTTKKLHLRSIIHELLWFVRGDTNIRYLHENKVTIWDEWADANGDLGPVYGAQWRSWPARDGSTIDQLSDVVARIRKSPDRMAEFGDSRAVWPAVSIDIRRSQAAAITEGDLIVIGGETYRIIGEPTDDQLRLVAGCEAVKV